MWPKKFWIDVTRQPAFRGCVAVLPLKVAGETKVSHTFANGIHGGQVGLLVDNAQRHFKEVYIRRPVSVTRYYYFGAQRVAMRKDGVVYYLVADHLGTTSLVLDAAGNKVAESRHLPYGQERWTSGTLPTDYRFTGQRDTGLGLYHMGARFYDAYINRWLSADTIVPNPQNPQSLNRYSWVLGNPLRYRDPTGHDIEKDRNNERIYEEALRIIQELAEKYDIWIIYELGADGTILGWDFNVLFNIEKGVQDFVAAMGGLDRYNQAMGSNTFFTIQMFWNGAGSGNYADTLTAAPLAPFPASQICFNPDHFNRRDEAIRNTVVHELAHAWDQQLGGDPSVRLEQATGGETIFQDGRERYRPGGPPPDLGAVNRREDWAYSSVEMVYGLGVGLNNPRYADMTRQFPGVDRPLEWQPPGR